jgi:sugar phosphate isomerase/epimerase
MYYTGFADEAAADLDTQIRATLELGWKRIETRKIVIDGVEGNLASIDDATFEKVCEKLKASGISFNCYGSGIGNWATRINQPPDTSYEEMRRAIPRMQRLGIKMVRVMNFPLDEPDFPKSWQYQDEAVKRMKTIIDMVKDTDIVCVHENCSGWASLSYEHTLKLLEKVNSPKLKLVFDTGNPVFDPDVRGEAPYKMQDAWEFYRNVKDHILYVHIKDGYVEGGQKVYTFPGEGHGHVRKIVEDLLRNGYDGGFSMEPHMKAIAHDASVQSEADVRYKNYVEYGRRFMKIIDETRKKLRG